MRKYLINSILAILVTTVAILIYFSVYGVKTESFNDLISDKIKEFNPKLSLDINDVFLKLNTKERSINIRTQNATIFIDREFIKLSKIDLNLDILNFLRKENSIKNIKITTDKNKIKNFSDFINIYKFSIPRLLIFNQIKGGNIKAEININFKEKSTSDFTFDVNAKIRDAKLKILNEYKVEKINFDLNIKDRKYVIENTIFKNEGINYNSKKIVIKNLNGEYEIDGDLSNEKGLIDLKYLKKILNYQINFIDSKKILAETENKFKFKIDSKKKIKDLNLSSKINFEEIFINKKIQNLISLQKGFVKTTYKKNILEVDIDSGYSFLNANYQNNTNDKIIINIIKNKNEDLRIKALIENENNSINSKEFLKYFKNIDKLVNDQNLKFGSVNHINFIINNKNKVENLKIKSQINLDEIMINYESSSLKKIFPNFKNFFNLKNNFIEIDYSKNITKIDSNGSYSIDDEYDNFNFKIVKNKNDLSFDSKISLNANQILFEEINYSKKEDVLSEIEFRGKIFRNKKIIFEEINYLENQNSMSLSNLSLTGKFKILEIENLKLKYLNNNKKLNELNVIKKNDNFTLNSKNFDGKSIIKNLINGDSNNSLLKKFKNLNTEIILNFDQFYVHDNDYLKKIKGSFVIENSNIKYGSVSAKLNNQNDFNLNVKTNSNNEKITNLFIKNPRPFIQNFNFIKGFNKGRLSYSSIEKNNNSRSNLKIYDFKIKKVPVLAKLLTLASLQGMADLLTGEGIRFDDFEMDYSSEKNITKIKELYAIGPSISFLMSGYIEKNKVTSLRGTLVPATTINKSIAKLPLVGELLVGKKTGEGVFGVSFKIKGPPKNLKTSVNPVKTLTPRFITRTLEKLKKD